jgi:hypothetical protein
VATRGNAGGNVAWGLDRNATAAALIEYLSDFRIERGGPGLAHGVGPRGLAHGGWPTGLAHGVGPRGWPTGLAHGVGPRGWPTGLAHDQLTLVAPASVLQVL